MKKHLCSPLAVFIILPSNCCLPSFVPRARSTTIGSTPPFRIVLRLSCFWFFFLFSPKTRKKLQYKSFAAVSPKKFGFSSYFSCLKVGVSALFHIHTERRSRLLIEDPCSDNALHRAEQRTGQQNCFKIPLGRRYETAVICLGRTRAIEGPQRVVKHGRKQENLFVEGLKTLQAARAAQREEKKVILPHKSWNIALDKTSASQKAGQNFKDGETIQVRLGDVEGKL
jgi:hypothetical protein